MNVVLTAPRPGVSIPSFPFGGAIFAGFSMQLLDGKDLQTITQAADGYPLPKQTSNDERREKDLQIPTVKLHKKARRSARRERKLINKKPSVENIAESRRGTVQVCQRALFSIFKPPPHARQS